MDNCLIELTCTVTLIKNSTKNALILLDQRTPLVEENVSLIVLLAYQQGMVAYSENAFFSTTFFNIINPRI
jgi:hypothetical protein